MCSLSLSRARLRLLIGDGFEDFVALLSSASRFQSDILNPRNHRDPKELSLLFEVPSKWQLGFSSFPKGNQASKNLLASQMKVAPCLMDPTSGFQIGGLGAPGSTPQLPAPTPQPRSARYTWHPKNTKQPGRAAWRSPNGCTPSGKHESSHLCKWNQVFHGGPPIPPNSEIHISAPKQLSEDFDLRFPAAEEQTKETS